MTQQQLAEKLCVSKFTISGWELNKQEPSIDLIIKLCNILETSPNELLCYETNELIKNG